MALKVVAPPEKPGIAGILEKKTAKLKARSPRGLGKRFRKILAVGKPGSGKTEAIAGLVRAGNRVFVLDTELGGTGLATVEASLMKSGHEALIDNVQYLELNDFDAIVDFLENPGAVEIEGVGTIYDMNPDVVAWEGFTNFQTTILNEYILDLACSDRSTPLRKKGMVGELRDWNGVKTGTMRQIQHFLTLRDAGRDKDWHKYMTVHLSDAKDIRDEETHALKEHVPEGPMLEGASRKLIEGAFDLIIKTVMSRPPGSKHATYEYHCWADDSDQVGKSRGLPIEPREPGDMEKLWYKITGVAR